MKTLDTQTLIKIQAQKLIVNGYYIWEYKSRILNFTCLCQGISGRLTLRERGFCYLPRVQTASEAHPAFCLMCAGGEDVSPRVKRLGQESNHSPQCNAEIKNEWHCTSSPPYAFMVCTWITLHLPLLLFYSYF